MFSISLATLAIRSSKYALLAISASAVMLAQSGAAVPVDKNATPPAALAAPGSVVPPSEDKRILFIFPNYRTITLRDRIEPLSTSQKYRLATQESFDPATLLLSGVYAGIGQATNQNPEWGQGGKGFAKRLGAAYADQAIGNYMTEAVFPSLLHQDPRYFRMGEGGVRKRAIYALTRVIRTRTDSGTTTWNYSEIAGNAVAAGIGSAYYPSQERSGSQVVSRLCVQVGTDAGFNVLKEFWPEIRHKFFKHMETGGSPASTSGQ